MARNYVSVRYIRQKRGTMAGFYRRCEAFYAQIDWDLECEKRQRIQRKDSFSEASHVRTAMLAKRRHAPIELLGGREA